MTCVSVCVLGLAMAMTPLTQAFVAPGSGFSAVHGRDVVSLASSKVGLAGSSARGCGVESSSYSFYGVSCFFRPFLSCSSSNTRSSIMQSSTELTVVKSKYEPRTAAVAMDPRRRRSRNNQHVRQITICLTCSRSCRLMHWDT